MIRDFALEIQSSARGIDFSPGSISPSTAGASGAGWRGRWEFRTLVGSAPISLELPQKTNPGPLAARLALAAVAPTPLLVTDAGAALVDGEITDALIDKAASLAQSAAKPISDMRGDADYRKHLVGVLTRRVVREAIERAKENK